MYTAKIDIDGDRWCKHPYGITVYDEDGNVVACQNYLDDREHCYRVSRKFNINDSDVSEDVY